ncbi:helix-turn-helix transcriptional regulator [Desulfosporosinus sp. Sb-LF]|uniref:helix-turn-helix domain-containing protein n=1 Tax=Desulfosporosinus sp. Sb-LF TaxID=2560027 RepID=UPI00107F0078|nr:helix-turn-helix transcriptional regulator [Desulfosporosinus sp. Sb-LF]TGE34516.1 XRE family transcriptional regulator [Desulfosporosinus sp. Sb-LF]
MRAINIAKVISAKRKEKGVTQDDLAEYIGVSKASVSKWETAQSYPDITLLPQLAAYFNISIDELVGYIPQMTMQDIRKTYHRLADDFSKKPFDEVLSECRSIIRKYYSCFPLLFKMAALLFNYCSLLKEKERQQALLQEICGLCTRIKTESGDAHLSKQANSIEAMCRLALGQPNEVLELLGENTKPITDDNMMIASAYQMTGNIEKAKSVLQVSLYQHLLHFAANAHAYLFLIKDEPERFEQALQRFIQLAECFDLEGLTPNSICQLYYAAANGYALLKNKEKALEMLNRYAHVCTTSLLPFKVKGDRFFDCIEEWFTDADLDLQAPRDEKTIKTSIVQSVAENPVFDLLKAEPGYKSILQKLRAFAKQPNY